MKSYIRLALVIILPFSLWFCSSHVLAPTDSEVKNIIDKYPGMDSTAINRGYIIFSENCHHCHKLKEPSRYSDEDWQKILPVMSKRAKLSKEETVKVQAYVSAFSKDKLASSDTISK